MSAERLPLFVYGTLMPGGAAPLAPRLAREAPAIGPATVPGRLLDCGAWPGLVAPARSGDRVHGVLLAAPPEDLLAELDAYEGCAPGTTPPLFVREVVEATDAADRLHLAWGWRLVAAPPGATVIPGGRWGGS